MRGRKAEHPPIEEICGDAADDADSELEEEH